MNSATLSFAKGARPEKGKNLAIAEWPTASGPADYVLFVGLMPVAVVEAKRKNIDVSGSLQQAKRYSRTFTFDAALVPPGGPWRDFQIPQVIERIEAGLNVRCDERPPAEGERGLVKISAVTWGTYDDNESKTLPGNAQLPERSRIRIGDFLISRANTVELVGACVIVHAVTRPVFLSDKILRLVMPEEWKPWLLLVLRSPAGRREIEARASGNQLSMRNLSQRNFREIQVPIPSPDERAEIVLRVETLLRFAGEIEGRCRLGRANVENLTPSALAKAFRGELVPQDPNDEPASRLLARLRSHPDSAAKLRKAKRGTRGQSTGASA